MRRLQHPIPYDVVVAQRRAADPSSSVWVEANAGSGKTYVLTRRVLRLLLAGVRPEEILCLTYTKAAAAEMRKRAAETLARWAVLDDAELVEELAELDGAAPSPGERLRARTLFAHALETPGGLKIVTIHAFCESVLHRFPVEAQVPFDFSVLEDQAREDMIRRARESVLAGGLGGSPEAAAVATLFDLLSDHGIAEAIDAALGQGRKLRHVLADIPAAKAGLRDLVGLPPGESRSAILAEIVAGHGLGADDYDRVFALCPPTVGGNGFEDKLAHLPRDRPEPMQVLATFLTADQTTPKRFPKKALMEADPALGDRLLAEARRLEALAARLNRATLVERSEALLTVLAAISERYETEKRARSLLDFDDLIEKLAALLRDPAQGPWVQYKLDTGITHVLVDESQDTNVEQWAVVKALAAEFFAGSGAVQKLRTLFAVGDGKQSIYSFQGAEPRLFGQSGQHFQAQAKDAGLRFDRQPLWTSFRTLPGILLAVDTVFADEALRQAVLSELPVSHATARAEAGGMVTLWPPVQATGEPIDPDNWPLQPTESIKSAPRQVAERIAAEIGSWIETERPLGPRGRAVRADDVLILVQKRSALFHEIIRALLRAGLPTPGADRLAVTGHIGVLDLLALGDVLLNPADDLQLAALLRSPLFDLSEDDLFDLAQPRADHARLWDALARSELAPAQAAYNQLAAWRGRLDFERPYEFYAQILYAEGGLRRFHARLGQEVDDVFAEFLDLALAHEQTSQPSLQGFLFAMRARDISIKRELNESGGGVRVMTVHGAKGLEAPIVILADAASKPQPQQLARAVTIRSEPPLFVHGGGKKDHLPETEMLRDEDKAAQLQEYWRKLYVGMTRAEDELYVTGPLTPGRDAGKQLEGSWYEALERALRPQAEVLPDVGGESLVFPRERPPLTAATATAVPVRPPSVPFVPAALPEAPHVPLVRPSSAVAPGDELRIFDTAADAARDAETARREGIALHALLQHLGQFERSQWDTVAQRALEVLLPAAPERHAGLAAKTVSLLTRPDLAHLFGDNSRAEVPFLANGLRRGRSIRLAGRIDRLVVEPGRVLVVDFKSDYGAVADPAAIPAAYQVQLGLYALVATQLFPDRPVHAAILWTRLESLIELPQVSLAAATDGFTMS